MAAGAGHMPPAKQRALAEMQRGMERAEAAVQHLTTGLPLEQGVQEDPG